jgi:dTMP kinase
MTVRRAAFVTFEGIEGTGKTTQIARLARRLKRAGREVVLTREPGGTGLGRRLRRALLQPDADPISAPAELLLYVGDRAQHLAEVVEPALARGAVVLCDRYVDATLAYQGYGRGLDLQWIRALHWSAPLDRRPDRTILIDLEAKAALARARKRNRARGLTNKEGRFERERLAFHRRVRAGYLKLARVEPARIRLVDGRGEPGRVEERVLAALAGLFPELETPAW